MKAVAERYCPACERSYHEGRRCPDDGTPLISIGPGNDAMLGRTLDNRYTIHERLGAGGMGTVYRGTQHVVGRPVAIKVVGPGLVANPEVIKRFLREAKLASRLSHANAVSVLDFGRAQDGVFYLVMELLVGSTLDAVVKRDGRLPLARALGIAAQICDVLDEAHRMSIIHRDLKPGNVMLLDGGDRDRVKVLDFGLAKSLSADTTAMSMTGTGALLGTPPFMSPEAALGLPLDTRSDLYSLGCLLYYLVSGRLAFSSRTVQEVLAMQISRPPPALPEVDPAIDEVIMRLLEKDPDRRYESAAATRAALEAAFATVPVAARATLYTRSPSPPAVTSETSVIAPSVVAPSLCVPPRPRRLRYAAIGLLSIAIGACVGFSLLHLRGREPLAPLTELELPAVAPPTSSVVKQAESAAAAESAVAAAVPGESTVAAKAVPTQPAPPPSLLAPRTSKSSHAKRVDSTTTGTGSQARRPATPPVPPTVESAAPAQPAQPAKETTPW